METLAVNEKAKARIRLARTADDNGGAVKEIVDRAWAGFVGILPESLVATQETTSRRSWAGKHLLAIVEGALKKDRSSDDLDGG